MTDENSFKSTITIMSCAFPQQIHQICKPGFIQTLICACLFHLFQTPINFFIKMKSVFETDNKQSARCAYNLTTWSTRPFLDDNQYSFMLIIL